MLFQKKTMRDIAYPHLSIADGCSSFDLSKCTSSRCGCRWVHCPLCEPGRIGVGTSTFMWKHFTKIHVLPAVSYQDVKLMVCLLDCSKQKHYHCPKCGMTIDRATRKRTGITEHLLTCIGEPTQVLDNKKIGDLHLHQDEPTEIDEDHENTLKSTTGLDHDDSIQDMQIGIEEQCQANFLVAKHENMQTKAEIVHEDKTLCVDLENLTTKEIDKKIIDNTTEVSDISNKPKNNQLTDGDTVLSTVVYPHSSILQGDQELLIIAKTEAGAAIHDCSLCCASIRSLQVNRHREWHRSSQVKWADCHILGCTMESCLLKLSHRRSRYHFHFHCPWCREVLLDRRTAISHYSSQHPAPPHNALTVPDCNKQRLEKRLRSSIEDPGSDLKRLKRERPKDKPESPVLVPDEEVFDTVTVHVSHSTLGHLSATSSNIEQRLQLETGVNCTVQAAGLSLVGNWDQVGKARELIKQLCAEDNRLVMHPAKCISMQDNNETVMSMPVKDKKTTNTANVADSPDRNKSLPMRTRNSVEWSTQTRFQHGKVCTAKRTLSSVSKNQPNTYFGSNVPLQTDSQKCNKHLSTSFGMITPGMKKMSQKPKIAEQDFDEESFHHPQSSPEYSSENEVISRKSKTVKTRLRSLPACSEVTGAISSQLASAAGGLDNAPVKSESENPKIVGISSDTKSNEDLETLKDDSVDLYIIDADTLSMEASSKTQEDPTVPVKSPLSSEIVDAEMGSIPIPEPDLEPTGDASLMAHALSNVSTSKEDIIMTLSTSLLDSLPSVAFQTPVPDDVPVLNIIPQVESTGEKEMSQELVEPINNVVSLNGVNIKLDEAYIRNVTDEKLSAVITEKAKSVVDKEDEAGTKQSKVILIKREPGVREECPACDKKLPLIDLVKHVLSSQDCKDELGNINLKENNSFTSKVQRLIIGLSSVVNNICPTCGLRRRTAGQALYHYAAGFCVKGEPIDKNTSISNEDFCMTHGVLRDPVSKLYKCSKCPMQARKPIHLKNHIEAFHLPKVFSCPHCPRMFTTEQKREYHMRVHKDLVECPQCKKMFMASYLPQHIEKLHQNVTVYCKLCDFVTKSYDYLQRHIDNMHSTNGNLCDWCGKHFGQKSTMRKHIQAVHLGIKYKRKKPARLDQSSCSICGETMLKKNLSTHIRRRHEKIKQYECDICGAKFTSNNSVKVHKMKHMSEAEKDHMMRFGCDVCGQKFHKRYLQQEHIRGHQLTYQCDKCLKSFRYKQTLCQHQKRHGACNTDGKSEPLQCSLCPKTYYSQRTLANHMTKVHDLLSTATETQFLHQFDFEVDEKTEMTTAEGISQMTEYIVQDIQEISEAQPVIQGTVVEQILAEVSDRQDGLSIIWPKSESAVQLQKNHPNTEAGHLVTESNHLVTEACHLVTGSVHLVTEAGQLLDESGHIVTETSYPVAEASQLVNEQVIEVPEMKIEADPGMYQPNIGLTLMQAADGTVFETETIELQEEEFITIEDSETNTTEFVQDIGYPGNNVQFQCGHCDMLFVSMEDVNAHVIATHG